MSNKTIKQRIAVVAVSALTAGILSVMSTPIANASAGAGGISVTTVTGNVTTPAVNGGSTTGTGTITVGGSVSMSITGGSAVFVEARVSGGTFTSVGSGALVNSDSTVAYQTAALVAGFTLTAKPTTAGRNMVITTYSDSTAALAAADTTAIDTLTITVLAAGVSGVPSAGNSFVQILNNASTIGSATSNTDVTYAALVAAGGYGVIGVVAKDGAGNSMPATSTIQATVKSGACIVDTDTSPAVTSVSATAASTTFYVTQADGVNTPPAVCSIGISVNGTDIATKTLQFQGPVSKLTVYSPARVLTSGGSVASPYFNVTDAAGTKIGGVSVSGDLVNASDANLVTTITSNTTGVGSASVNGGTNAATTDSQLSVTCSSTSTATPVKIRYKISNGLGGYIYSEVIDQYCAGQPVNYKASLDKATYAPGDVATLTITATDSKGNPVHDAATLGAGSAISIAGGVLTATTAPASNDTFTDGKATYKYTVGTTEGAYNLVVDLTARNSTTYSQSAVTVAYKVASTTPSVSNADVLKSIVALIASINKQIQALQKLILRR